MKRIFFALALSGLISAGLYASSSGTSDQSAPAEPINQVLQAHNALDAEALSAFNAEAVRLTFYNGGEGSKSPDFFERILSVSSRGNAFRRHKSDPMGLSQQFNLFDGQAAYQAEIERGNPVAGVNQVEDSRFEGVQFSIRTFGLVPILRQLADSATEVVYLGATDRKRDMFEVKTAVGSWTIYTDHRRLIRKVVIGNKTIEYAGYRSVEGVQLPFIQRFAVGEHPVYEIFFTSINLNPTFPEGYFTHEALNRDVGR